MKTRIIASVILLPVFLAVLLIFPPYILTFVISVLCAIAAYELTRAMGSEKSKASLVFTIIAAALMPVAVHMYAHYPAYYQFSGSLGAQILAALIFMLIIEAMLMRKKDKLVILRLIIAVLGGGVLIPQMLSGLISLRAMPAGHLLVLLPVVSAFLTDTGAYFTGKAIGKRQAFPGISPNKTVEGCIGGLITGTAGMLIYGVILASTTQLNVKFLLLIVYGVAGSVITELGDLAFSLIKRKRGIKDYGKLIPGHGGVLDRFDSMAFCAPAMYLLMIFLPAIS